MEGLIFAIISPFFSSISTIFKSGAAKSLSPIVVVGIGGLLGSIVLFLISFMRHEHVNLSKLKRHWRSLAAIIIFRTLLGELFLTYGLSLTTGIKAIFFTKIEPYFVLLISAIFLREKIAPRHFILLAVHLLGAIVLSTGGKIDIVSRAQIGDLLVITAMGFFAFSYSYGKKVANAFGSTLGNAISMGIGTLIIIPFMLVFAPRIDYSSQFKGWIYLIIYVILFNVVALTFWYVSLKTVKGWIASALRYVGPILGAPVAYILFGETLSLEQIGGAAIVIITSFLIAREHIKNKGG